jgi:hypothetical protein
LSAGFARASSVPHDETGLELDGIDLPLGTRDERVLLAAARNMPAVKTAMDQFRQMGYVAHPECDRAVMALPGTNAICFLIYEKPGYVPEPNTIGAPVIMVVTVKYWDATRTRTGAGFVVMDGNRQSWNVVAPKGGATSYRIVEWFKEREAVFVEYAACAGAFNSLCVMGAIGFGLAGTPAAGVGYGLACVAGASATCLGTIVFRPH